MSDYELPELPSDEELGIAGMEEEEEAKPSGERRKSAPPGPTPPAPRRGGGGGGGEGPAAPPAPEEPRRPWRGPVTLAALVILAWASTWGPALPDPAPAT
ncbi:MAG TPA: hypothetical protein VE173_05770, partial [Longimicrobiales bacterium]|nr:hypothetical protein [Longimicrobiales bacterium]